MGLGFLRMPLPDYTCLAHLLRQRRHAVGPICHEIIFGGVSQEGGILCCCACLVESSPPQK